ncbi:MAG: Gfo/Idh/MocA family oxidoreductase [Rhodobacteraceae bacterium]|nr:Gfo/Idh/MocA family oxidoreductase [Paracoccaceae bacterium]
MIRYGVIGCGMMGQEHVRNIALLPDARVQAIYEPDAAMAKAACALAPGAVFPRTLAALLEMDELDCLLIASPNFCHVAQLEQLAQIRSLPILVEKPLFTKAEDHRRITAFAARYRAPVWVAMEYRFMPPIAAFLARARQITGGVAMLAIREHRFPFLPKVGNWNRFNRLSGGTFVEKCCHFFDLMRLVLRSEPLRIMASGGQRVNHLQECYAGQVPDILDNGYVIVDFTSGARAVLDLCMFAEGGRYQEEICAVGPRGKIEALVPGPCRFWPQDLGPPPVAQLVISPRDPVGPWQEDIPVDPALLAAGDHNGATFFQHQRFGDLVRGHIAHPEVSLQDGTMAVLMGLAAQVSIDEGRVVSMDEDIFAAPAAAHPWARQRS